VFPMIYYNGASTPYPFSMNFWHYFKDPRQAKALMARPIHLVDVNQIADTFAEEHCSIFMELLLKYMRKKQDFLPSLQALTASGNLARTWNMGGESYIMHMLDLALRETEISSKTVFFETIEKTLPHVGEEVMSLLAQEHQAGVQQGILTGKQAGIQEGMQAALEKTALNLLDLGQTVTMAAQVTGLSLATLVKLREKAKV